MSYINKKTNSSRYPRFLAVKPMLFGFEISEIAISIIGAFALSLIGIDDKWMFPLAIILLCLLYVKRRFIQTGFFFFIFKQRRNLEMAHIIRTCVVNKEKG